MLPVLGVLWTGAKWLGGAVVTGLIGEYVSEKIEDMQTPPQVSNEQQAQTLLIMCVVAIGVVIITIHTISEYFKTQRKRH